MKEHDALLEPPESIELGRASCTPVANQPSRPVALRLKSMAPFRRIAKGDHGLTPAFAVRCSPSTVRFVHQEMCIFMGQSGLDPFWGRQQMEAQRKFAGRKVCSSGCGAKGTPAQGYRPSKGRDDHEPRKDALSRRDLLPCGVKRHVGILAVPCS